MVEEQGTNANYFLTWILSWLAERARRSLLAESVKNQFYSTGNAQLFIGVEEIVLDGMFTKSKPEGNGTVCKTLGNQFGHVCLARGKQGRTLGVDDAERR